MDTQQATNCWEVSLLAVLLDLLSHLLPLTCTQLNLLLATPNLASSTNFENKQQGKSFEATEEEEDELYIEELEYEYKDHDDDDDA